MQKAIFVIAAFLTGMSLTSCFSGKRMMADAKEKKPRQGQLQNMPPADKELFERLKETRLAIARAQRVAPYIVFSDKVLDVIARYRPTTREEFSGLYGVGEKKTEMYWRPFTSAVRTYLETHSGK